MLMYKVIFDGNVMVCQDLDDATETAIHLRNAEYSLVEVVPAEPTDIYRQEYILLMELVDDIDFDISKYCEDWEKPIDLEV